MGFLCATKYSMYVVKLCVSTRSENKARLWTTSNLIDIVIGRSAHKISPRRSFCGLLHSSHNEFETYKYFGPYVHGLRVQRAFPFRNSSRLSNTYGQMFPTEAGGYSTQFTTQASRPSVPFSDPFDR